MDHSSEPESPCPLAPLKATQPPWVNTGLMMAAATTLGLLTTFGGYMLWSPSKENFQETRSSYDRLDPTSHQPLAQTAHQGAIWLSVVASPRAAALLKKTHLRASQKERILEALNKRTLRLAIMPITLVSGPFPQVVTIRSGGVTQLVTLTSQWQEVLLPLYKVGSVQIQAVDSIPTGGLRTAIGTMNGTFLAPPLLSAEDHYMLDVIVQ